MTPECGQPFTIPGGYMAEPAVVYHETREREYINSPEQRPMALQVFRHLLSELPLLDWASRDALDTIKYTTEMYEIREWAHSEWCPLGSSRVEEHPDGTCTLHLYGYMWSTCFACG